MTAAHAERRTIDPRSGVERRHHVSDQAFQRALRQAVPDSRMGRGVIGPLDNLTPIDENSDGC